MGRMHSGLLILAMLVTLSLTAVRIGKAVPIDAGLEHVSGVWLTQATDLVRGVFYRPVVSEYGYGGTRYMPLHFVVHAALICTGLSPAAGGYLITLFAALAVSLGMFVILRRLGVSRLLAAASSVLWMGTTSSQFALTTIRGDLLPAALNLWGIALCLPPKRLGDAATRPVLAALFFVLAVSAKITTVFGFAGALLAFLISGHRKEALKLLAATFVGLVVAFAAIQLASHGRWFAVFCAVLPSGPKWVYLLTGPALMINTAVATEPVGLVMLCLACVAVVAGGRALLGVLPLTLVVAVAVVACVSGSPGIDYNHLLDLDILSLLVLAVLVSRRDVKAPWGAVTLAFMLTIACGDSFKRFQPMDRIHVRECALSAIREAGTSPLPVFSDDACPEIFAGERPYMMDIFAFKLARERDPAIALDFWERFSGRRFRAVILSRLKPGPAGMELYEKDYIGNGFADTLAREYQFSAQYGPYTVFLPKK